MELGTARRAPHSTNFYEMLRTQGATKQRNYRGRFLAKTRRTSRPLMEFARESSLRLRQQDTQKFLLPREGVVPHETTDQFF